MNKEWNKIVKWSILFLTSIFLLGLVSCEVEEYEPSPYRVAMMDLNKAKSKWRYSEIKHYKLEQRKQCFCPENVTNWNILEVDLENKIIKVNDSLVYGGDLQKGWPWIKPIKPLFDLVEHEIKSIPYSLDVQYNDEYGYVEYLGVDPHYGIADDEYTYQIKNFEVIK